MQFTALDILRTYRCPEPALQSLELTSTRLVDIRVEKTLDNHVRDVDNETSEDLQRSVKNVKSDFNARIVPLARDEEADVEQEYMAPTILNDTDEIAQMSQHVDGVAKKNTEMLVSQAREKLGKITRDHETIEVDLLIGKTLIDSGKPDATSLARDVERVLQAHIALWKTYGESARSMDIDDLSEGDEDDDWPQTGDGSEDYDELDEDVKALQI